MMTVEQLRTFWRAAASEAQQFKEKSAKLEEEVNFLRQRVIELVSKVNELERKRKLTARELE